VHKMTHGHGAIQGRGCFTNIGNKGSALSRFGRTVSDICKATVLMLSLVLLGFEVYCE